MAEMIMVFDWDGKTVHKETKGFTGKKCLSDTKFMEEALGESNDRRYKSDYYEEEKVKRNDKLRL